MKRIAALVSVFLVLVLMLAIPIGALSDVLYYADQTHYQTSSDGVAAVVGYPASFDALRPGTRFRLTLSDVGAYSNVDGTDSRFLFSFFQENADGVSSVFIDCNPRMWAKDWGMDNGYHMQIRYGVYIVGYGNIILGTYRAPLESKLLSMEALVTGTRMTPDAPEGVSHIAPEDISLIVQVYGQYYSASLELQTLSSADQQQYDDFLDNLAYSSFMSYKYDGTYDFGYHVRADYWSYDMTLVVDKDPQWSDLQAANAVIAEKDQTIADQNQTNWELNQTIIGKDQQIRRLEQIEDAYNRYMEMTDQGEKSIFAGFIDSIGNTLWTGVSMIFSIEVFDFTIGQIVAGFGIIAVLYIILKLITGGGSGK